MTRFVVEEFDGALVTLVQTLTDGTTRRRRLPQWLAAHEALFGDENGVTVASCRIEYAGVVDLFGHSFVPFR